MLKLLPLIFVFTVFQTFASVEFSTVEIANVSRFAGEVTVNGKTVNKFKMLKVGDHLIAKGKKSFIQFKTIYGSVILLKNGELKLTDLQKKSSKLELLKGEFFHYMKEKSKRSFTVKTRSTVMGVRGTKYYISERDEESYLCVCEGVVEAIRGDESELISKNEDLHVKDGVALKKLKANKMMIEMTASGFEEMGYPVK